MDKKNTPEKKRRLSLAAILFCAALAAGLLGLIFVPKQDYSALEKRYLAKDPVLTAETLFDGSFGDDFEEYLSDHFAGRSFFVGCYSYYSLLLGNNGANGVYCGQDGYLINEPVSPEDSILTRNMAALTALAENTGLPTTLIAVPSTGYIYSDKLPALHEEYRDNLYFSEIYAAIQGTGLELIDLRDTFLSQKDDVQLYYRTDHHWTTEAAYLAYQALCVQLGLEPLGREAFTIETVSGFKGTTSASSGFYLTAADDIQVWHNQALDGHITLEIWEGEDCETYDTLYFEENAQGDDQYTLFLDGNHSLQYIYNDSADGGTLLLVQDSFAHCPTPFLAAHYEKIVIVDPRYYKLPISQLAREEGADAILIVYGIDNLCTDTDVPFIQ
ncbi:MAG: hypothetical protein LUE21_04300 [Oscillospiraceae bacterium]|nr:hypothetical protein [Oscillospiraceae bacterium]